MDAQHFSEKIKAVWRFFCKNSYKKIYRIGQLRKPPVIIGGCPRSGTTLLSAILSAHPHIYSIPVETWAFCPLREGGGFNYNAPLRIDRVYKYLMMADEIPAECTRWCEKSPPNVLFFGKILKHFGKNVKLVNIVRDGRDVVLSRHPSDPDKFYVPVDKWVNYVKKGKEFEEHPQVFCVRYEDIIRDYENTLRKVCIFLEEEFVSEFMRFPESSKVKTLQGQFKSDLGGIYVSSQGRWRREEFRDEVEAFMKNDEAVALLRHYGYI